MGEPPGLQDTGHEGVDIGRTDIARLDHEPADDAPRGDIHGPVAFQLHDLAREVAEGVDVEPGIVENDLLAELKLAERAAHGRERDGAGGGLAARSGEAGGVAGGKLAHLLDADRERHAIALGPAEARDFLAGEPVDLKGAEGARDMLHAGQDALGAESADELGRHDAAHFEAGVEVRHVLIVREPIERGLGGRLGRGETGEDGGLLAGDGLGGARLAKKLLPPLAGGLGGDALGRALGDEVKVHHHDLADAHGLVLGKGGLGGKGLAGTGDGLLLGLHDEAELGDAGGAVADHEVVDAVAPALRQLVAGDEALAAILANGLRGDAEDLGPLIRGQHGVVGRGLIGGDDLSCCGHFEKGWCGQNGRWPARR